MKKFLIGLIVGLVIAVVPAAYAMIAAPVTFTDVAEGDWFHTPVTELAGMGVIDGYSDGSYKPGNIVTRAEVAKLLYELYNRTYNNPEVADLETRIEILEAKVSTLTFPGQCYYNETWYETGDFVDQDNVVLDDVMGPGRCVCDADGGLSQCEFAVT